MYSFRSNYGVVPITRYSGANVQVIPSAGVWTIAGPRHAMRDEDAARHVVLAFAAREGKTKTARCIAVDNDLMIMIMNNSYGALCESGRNIR